jgi:uncharacterized membrane protein
MESVLTAPGNVSDMPPRSLVALLVLVVALLAAPVAGLGSPFGAAPGTPASGGTASGDPASLPAQQEPTTAGPPVTATPNGTVTATPPGRATLPPSEEVWRVQLRPGGDARWQIAVTVPVRNAEDAAAFDELAEEFGTTEDPLRVDFFRTAAAGASAETGREMEISGVSRSAGRENGTGTLAVSFTWSNFARAEGDRLSVGDGFNTTRGTWLPGLSGRQTLLVAPPSGYGVTSAPEVGITGGTARWEGPYDFEGREPWIVYSGDAPTPTGTSTTAPGTNATETPDGGPVGSLLSVVALAVLAGVSAAVLVAYMHREDGDAGAIVPTTGGNPDDGAAAASAGGSDAGAVDGDGSGVGSGGGSESASTGGRAGDATAGGAAAGAGAAGGSTADGAEDDGINEELLSDEERVERLLERNGGRMKQGNIVKETGWSNAKVSQLLSSMAEEERIDKLRIGRENLISFPDEDVADLDSE